MADRYRGYDALAKRDTPSWDDITRTVIARRLALPDRPRFLPTAQWVTLDAVAARVVPQPEGRSPIPVASLVDEMLFENRGPGFRDARMPRLRDAWLTGLRAIEAEAEAAGGVRFRALPIAVQDKLLRDMSEGRLTREAWGDMPCALFFSERLIPDLIDAYYAHPSAWSAIGFGGPASPRGYVRLGPGLLDPWEAREEPHAG